VNNFGPVVTDIESHLHAGHPYREADLIGWVHEGTHGINADLRSKFRCPCFYVLNNRVVRIQHEPATTITRVSRLVPISLRGAVYKSYLIDSRQYWEHQPSYLWDEWVAYTNGAEARRQLAIHERGETVEHMMEFCVYSACVAWSAKSDDPQIRFFIMWQIERSLSICRASGIRNTYFVRLRASPDAEVLRVYMRNYFGVKWTLETLGF